ncbi:MAG: threonine--tRNA ligase [Phycisphaeraceae bacterium]
MKVTLPDGSIKEYPGPVAPAQVAADIGAGLAKAAIGAKVDGQLWDLRRQIEKDCSLAIITKPRLDKEGKTKGPHNPDALYLLRHSCAHVMAEAIQRLWPAAQLAYGPPLDNGFYYDMFLEQPISTEDFPRIEEEMRKIVEENRSFMRFDLPSEIGMRKLKEENNKYKLDNADRALQGGSRSLSWYVTGTPDIMHVGGRDCYQIAGLNIPIDVVRGSVIPIEPLGPVGGVFTGKKRANWEDLCMGPHVPATGEIAAFKIMSVASSNWKGDVTLDRFQRVYGTAFFSQADLDAHLALLDEAKKRDHRVLGKQLRLFHIDEQVGQGLVLWTPRGAVIRQTLQTFISEELRKQGYSQVFTPHIGKLDLYRTSGHFPYYQESQYPPLIERETLAMLAKEGCTCGELANRMEKGDIEGYMLKPMNCPHHIRIFASEKRSYRDMPVRLAEFGTVYRWEKSGEIGGMTRVRGFTQDDAHLFVTEDQLAAEVQGCLSLVKIIFKTLGINDYRVRVGLRDPDSSKYVGDASNWDKAEAACKAAAASLGVPFTTEPGEAAFYGPKIDFVVKDVIGREWQLGTVQVDYNLPIRFDLSYVGADNKPHRPVMIHRAPFGSMERFVGVLIEHFAGAFPLWLSPEQMRVLPVSDKFLPYAKQVFEALKDQAFRVHLDESGDRVNAMVKVAQDDKVNYMLIVGGKDEAAGTVSVRDRSRGDLGAIPLQAFIEKAKAELANFGEGVVTV